MISPKRIGFVLALTAAIFVTAICVSNFEQNSATASSVKVVRVLRRKDKKQDKPSAAEASSAQEASEERKFEDDMPKHLPLKFKLKAEKEKKFKDLSNHEWYRDFELEVTNTSNKPIYFLLLWLEFPEIDVSPGLSLAFPLQYGRMNFIYQKTRPMPTDVPIQPGETYVFTVSEQDRKGWEEHKQRDSIPDPKKTLLTFVHLSFGDGTGFATSGAKPYPFRDHQSFAPFCRDDPATIVTQGGGINKRPKDLQTTKRNNSLLAMTARNSGGHFSFVNDSYSFLEDSSARTDICCGSGCYFLKSNMESCSCGDSPGFDAPACSDPEATCGTHGEIGHWCPNLGVYCPQYRIVPCVGDVPTPPPTPLPSPTPTSTPTPDVPTPTPTPAPEPTCNPATKPNNSNCNCNTVLAIANLGPPFWDCGQGCSGALGADYTKPQWQSNLGCPPNKYNDGTDCCRCIVQTCFDGQPANVTTCECPSPVPTPTPTATQSGGDGGTAYYRGCVDYYWVWFVSYDGGVTWEATGEWEYAGCFYVS